MANESIDLAFAGQPYAVSGSLDTSGLDYACGGQPFVLPATSIVVIPTVTEAITLTSSQSTSITRAPTVSESVTLVDYVSVSIVRAVYVSEVFTLTDTTSTAIAPEEDVVVAGVYSLDYVHFAQPYVLYGRGRESLGLDYVFHAQPEIMTKEPLLGGIQPSIEIISMPQMVPFP
jgi:hypothetical protein